MLTLITEGDEYFLAIIIRGDTKVSFKKVKKLTEIKNLRMATPKEFTAITNLPLGAARAYTAHLKTIIDTKILEKEYLIGGSRTFDCSAQCKTHDLKKIPESIVGDISISKP